MGIAGNRDARQTNGGAYGDAQELAGGNVDASDNEHVQRNPAERMEENMRLSRRRARYMNDDEGDKHVAERRGSDHDGGACQAMDATAARRPAGSTSEEEEPQEENMMQYPPRADRQPVLCIDNPAFVNVAYCMRWQLDGPNKTVRMPDATGIPELCVCTPCFKSLKGNYIACTNDMPAKGM